MRYVLGDLRARGVSETVLEIGGGDGAFVEPLLAYGARVTTTEMSRPSLAQLDRHYGHNPAFRGVFDADGSLEVLGDERYGLVLFSSVLHHIPDYMRAIDSALGHLVDGGALVTLQDPLWYPRLPAGHHALSEAAYLLWRLRQGELARGVRTRVRHHRDVYRDDEPGDVVEYHVVRNGVDEKEVLNRLRPRFSGVDLQRYWSTPGAFLQALGERVGLTNAFAVVALGHGETCSRVDQQVS